MARRTQADILMEAAILAHFEDRQKEAAPYSTERFCLYQLMQVIEPFDAACFRRAFRRLKRHQTIVLYSQKMKGACYWLPKR